VKAVAGPHSPPERRAGRLSAGNILHLYLIRLRARAAQELLALVGIAAGVALLFASLVASSSLTGSIADLNAGIVGRATLQLSARTAKGFPDSVLTRVRAIPGVRVAAPLLELDGHLAGPRGSADVQVIGAEQTLASLGGRLTRRVALTPFPGLGALVLPEPLASRLGARTEGPEMTLKLAGRRNSVALFATLTGSEIGGLVRTPVAIGPLEYVQQLSGLTGRLTRILIEPAPGSERAVRAVLMRIASAPTAPGLQADRLNLQPSDWEVRLFAKAATATNQSTDLFAVLSALVGFLFAFNAVLLTAPARRRLIADLRREGYSPWSVLAVVIGDAVGLALAACAVGLVLGDELSIHLFSATPGYLSSAFALGPERVVGWKPPVLAALGGVGAALTAVLSPAREIFSPDPLAINAGSLRRSGKRTRWTAAGGLAALGGSLAVLLAAPAQAVWGILALVAALVALLPLAVSGAAWLLGVFAPLLRTVSAHVAIMELRSGGPRAVAITATCGIAVLGASSLQASRGDLLAGLDNAARDVNAPAQAWVAPPGSSSLLLTQPFSAPAPLARAIARLPGVRVTRYDGALLDVGERRVWVLAPSSGEHPLIPPSQLIEGSLTFADQHVAAGGWAMVSLALAQERHLSIGDRFLLPAVHPLTLRVAAIGTNIGWAPGAIVIGATDFARGWGSTEPAALAVHIAPRAAVPATVRRIGRMLSPNGLQAVSARSREQRQRTLTRQGLSRLSDIATLMLVAAALAVAAVIGAMIWQRRPRLAKLKLEGFSAGLLWRTIVLESVLLVGVGALAGGVLALLGQRLLDQALSHVVNYPVQVSVGVVPVLQSIALVTAAAVAIVAVPGLFAVRVPASIAMEE
jgi:putative ABC transport system permease protein